MKDEDLTYSEPDDRMQQGTEMPTEMPKKRRNGAKKQVVDVLSGNVLEKNGAKRLYPIALYCAFLILLYIAYVFNYQRIQRMEIRQKIELQEERSRALVFSSMRMNVSRHSAILEQIEIRGIDIAESPTPPKVIEKK